ncbi:MAG: ferrochelatase [Proteobacteria bacterium]|nr:ferrochelatase [Pseudomonadota bacterium]
MNAKPQAPFAHDRMPRLGVLLVNLGTPDAPTAPAVRRYLHEFLTDPRVVEIPGLAWRAILHGVVLRTRPAQSARRYEAIWTPDGSPLLVHSHKQRTLLLGYLGQRLKAAGLPADYCPVELGMRYGKPSIADALAKLAAANVTRLLVLPLYPQYAASTTASAFDALGAALRDVRWVPAIRFVGSFHDDAGYVKAMARVIHDDWMKNGRPDHLVLSFHGVPRRTLELGDPYHCECQKTARLLATEMGLSPEQWTLSFQSRFGRAQWLTPYTADVLGKLGKAGVGRVDVFCPGFVADCLETLEEIGIEGRAHFVASGGKELHMVPCLNTHPAWIAALADIAMRELAGWLAPPPDAAAREMTKARAKALGAPR